MRAVNHVRADVHAVVDLRASLVPLRAGELEADLVDFLRKE